MDSVALQFFVHLPDHKIVVCRKCQFAVPPLRVEGHLKRNHQRISPREHGPIIDAVLAIPRSSLAYEHRDVKYSPRDGPAVPGIVVRRNTFACEHRLPGGKQCLYLACTRRTMQEHCRTKHSWKNPQRRGGNKAAQTLDGPNVPWRTGVCIQEVFREVGWKQYNEVEYTPVPDSSPPSAEVSSFFARQKRILAEVEERCREQAGLVAGFGDNASAVEPWIQKLGIDQHLEGLNKDDIAAAIAQPDIDSEPVLHAIVSEANLAFLKAHSLANNMRYLPMSDGCQEALAAFRKRDNHPYVSIFRRLKQPKALHDYISTTCRLICYFHRAAWSRSAFANSPSTSGPSYIQPTEEQNHLYARIIDSMPDKASSSITHSDSAIPTPPASSGVVEQPDFLSLTMTQELILRFIVSLHCHSLGANVYQAPLISFSSMFSMRPGVGSWEEPGNFSSRLSALIWIGQLAMWADIAFSHMHNPDSVEPLVVLLTTRTLGSPGPCALGDIHRWRSTAYHVSRSRVSQHHVEWDESGNSLTFEGAVLELWDVSTLVSSLYKDAYDTLHSDLLLGLNLRPLSSEHLSDPPDDRIGFSFLDNPANGLSPAKTAILEGIEGSDSLRRHFMNKERQWRDSALVAYEHQVQKFLHRLAVLIWITSGQPVREPEFLSMKWCNTEKRRNVTIRSALIMIHLTYWKGQSTFGVDKNNIRFLELLLGNLLIMYLAYVQPLRTIFRQSGESYLPPCPHLFEKDGEVWREGIMSREMERACARNAVPRLHISNWRHITVAIVKVKFSGVLQFFECDHDNADAEETSDVIVAMNNQRNHKTHTANHNYANSTASPFSSLWDGLIHTGRKASQLWHDFWHLNELFSQHTDNHIDSVPVAALQQRPTNVIAPRTVHHEDALLQQARKLYRRDDLCWKSTQQAEALVHISAWKPLVLAVLPTGGGKSLLFMLPCMMPSAGVTILVLPLVSLRSDMLRRLQSLSIPHLVWSFGETRQRPLVIVSVEAAASKDFLSYAQGLAARQCLDRVVFDECHLTCTAASYRPAIEAVTKLRQLPTQFVYLTATLPPSLLSDFLDRNALPRQITTVRASADRPNILYNSCRIPVPPGTTYLSQAVSAALKMWDGLHPEKPSRAIFYTTTREDAIGAAALLGCDSYTSLSGTQQEREEIIRQWLSGEGSPFITATQALAEGFDYHSILLVTHLGPLLSLLEYVQQVGRCGRGLLRAKAALFLPPTWQPPVIDQALLEPDVNTTLDMSLAKAREQAWANVFNAGGSCARHILGRYLDESYDVRRCGTTARCSFCHANPPAPKRKAESPLPSSTPERQPDRYDGRRRLLESAQEAELSMSQYQDNIMRFANKCFYCRFLNGDTGSHDHSVASCTSLKGIIDVRQAALRRHKEKGSLWLARYAACWTCLQPQSICPPGTLHTPKSPCRFKDVVLPTCLALYRRPGAEEFFSRHFSRSFPSEEHYIDWIGQKTKFGGNDALQGVRVAALALASLESSPLV